MTDEEARRRAIQRWNRTVGPYYSRATLLRDLALTSAQLDERIDRAEILRLERSGKEFFPAFQFAGELIAGTGIREVRLLLNRTLDPEADWSVTLWLCVRRAEFGGANAVELLQEGRLPEVLEVARRSPVGPSRDADE